MRAAIVAGTMILVAAPAVAQAETPRDILITAAFQTPDKARALALIGRAITASDAILSSRPDDREATLQRGIAIGYRAKLTRSRSDAKASLAIFEKLAARNPRDAEVQMVIAGWHLDAIDQLGGFIARTMLGARAQAGDAAMARAVSLGGDRAFYPAFAALMGIRQHPANVAEARRHAEAAARAATPTPLDTLMQRSMAAILPMLRANDGEGAADLARKLLPFGRIG